METRQGDIEVKKADLQAQAVRLRQVRRRLELLRNYPRTVRTDRFSRVSGGLFPFLG
jgi:hypothetical protein